MGEDQPETAEMPAPPFVLWDGECGFCRKWVEHWKETVGPDVTFLPYQEAPPELLAEWDLDEVELAQAMHFVEGPERQVHRGAAAVFELLSLAPEVRYELLLRLYRSVPPFALVADGAYRRIAEHRVAAAKVTKTLWGQPQRSTYQVARALFMRLLALSTFVAFWSYGRQVDGIVGSNGILPAADFIDRAREILVVQRGLEPAEAFWKIPTVFWFDSSDATLAAVCSAGMVGSALLFLGILPRLVIPLLWFGYLSLSNVGQIFLGYQWDALLLEALFVAWFVAPWSPVPGPNWRSWTSPLGRGLVWLLVFKLMFLCGFVKFAADESWRSLNALGFHFWTQPIPNNVAYWVDKLPPFVKGLGVGLTFAAEIIAPILIVAPRRARHVGAVVMIILQLLIMLTGTFGFFNLLTIALCVMLFDDGFFGERLRQWGRAVGRPWKGWIGPWILGAALMAPLVALSMNPTRTPPEPDGWWQQVDEVLGPFRTFNTYGVFSPMTTTRPEILVERSDDGVTWQPYDFRWKPTAVDEPLRFTTLHMPRLDWQMWFAALGSCGRNVWFHAFVKRLLEGSDEVELLLEGVDPSRSPPKYVRSTLYSYSFGKDSIWIRLEKGPYCPTFTLDSAGELAVAR